MKQILFLIICTFFSISAISQETSSSDSLLLITMKNGDEYIGKILSDDGREVLLISKEIGKIYLLKENIKSIEPFKEGDFKIVDGEYRSSGPFTTRYYFTTNALPIKKRENYAMINLFGPEVHFAVSDKFSAGIMTTWIASPMVVSLKYTVPTNNPKINFGLGTLMGTSGYLMQGRGYGGLHWGMLTFGDRLTNFTISGGFAYIDPGFDKTNAYSLGTVTQPGNYDAITDLNGYSYFPYYPGDLPFQKKKLVNAPIIGIGAITKLGKKASFIFDSMFLFGSIEENRTTYFYLQPDNLIPDYMEVTLDKSRSLTVFFMPAVRFSTKPDRAFQFAAAGVVARIDGDYVSFPVPMCSWFFKF